MAVDYFLKLDGIKGESEDAKHKDEIEVLSWSWSETNSGSMAGGRGGGSGKVAMQDFNFVMRVNTASPPLFQKCAAGEHIPKGTLTCRKAGKEQQEYMTIKFSDLLVSSYQTGGSEGDEIPVDQISLNFSKIEFEYKPQKEDGSLAGAISKWFDLKQMKGG
jgi:type VI secretion system secreted protein Hcp